MEYKEILLTIIASVLISIFMAGLTLTVTKKYNCKEKPETNSTQTTTYTIRIAQDCKNLKLQK